MAAEREAGHDQRKSGGRGPQHFGGGQRPEPRASDVVGATREADDAVARAQAVGDTRPGLDIDRARGDIADNIGNRATGSGDITLQLYESTP